MAERRCLVLADSFYEWKKIEKRQKTPYRFQFKTGEPFAFAGIWEENETRTAKRSAPLPSSPLTQMP